MAAIVTAPELDIRSYVASLGLNPDNVFYQRVQSNNVTTASAQWQITSPNKRSLLLSWAAVDWQPTIQRRRADQTTAQDFDSAGDQISFKPVMPFTNAMTSQTLSINGNSLTLSQPRRFSEQLGRMCVGRSESRSCYETQWWNSYGGQYGGARGGNNSMSGYIDEGLRMNEDLTKQKLLRANGANAAAGITLNGANNLVVSYQEPLLVPPFNPYLKVSDSMPDYLPWKWMSPVIPNIDRLEVDIQFNPDKLAAGALFYRYAHADTNNEVKNLTITALAADLLLYWYEVPVDMAIPRSVDMQTWNLREFQSPVAAGVAQVNGVLATQRQLTDLIQLRSVPSFIILTARRRQDTAAYSCRSMVSDDDFMGTGGTGSTDAAGAVVANVNHSLDTFMEIVSMNVILGDRPNVISTQFTQRELYYLTVKNCKSRDFSLAFNDWMGAYSPHAPNATAADTDENPLPDGTYNVNLAKSFVVLRPKDIAEKISPGVFFPTSLQFDVNLRAKDGACGLAGGNQIFDLFTHVVVGKHFLRLEPDRAQYQEQSVTLEAALAALKPGLAVPGSTGGALTSLRDRAAGYSSRL